MDFLLNKRRCNTNFGNFLSLGHCSFSRFGFGGLGFSGLGLSSLGFGNWFLVWDEFLSNNLLDNFIARNSGGSGS